MRVSNFRCWPLAAGWGLRPNGPLRGAADMGAYTAVIDLSKMTLGVN
jgi:hypothetical protein